MLLVISIVIILILIYYLFILENYICIKNKFLTQNEIEEINKLLKNIQNYKELDYKKYTLLDFKKYKFIYDIIYKNDFLKKKIKKEFNINLKYPNYPIEYRIYKKNTELLPWHQDKKLMNNYLECIYIIENSSDSYFQYLKNIKIHKYYQKNNDLIIVKPRDIIHNITPFHKGEKIILKFIINI